MTARKTRTVEQHANTGVGTGVPLPFQQPVEPRTFTTVLSNGVVAEWRMPDPFKVIAFDGMIPDPTTAATIELLMQEKALTSDADPRKWRMNAQTVRGLYGLASHMLVNPRLDVSQEYGDGKGVLGRCEIGYRDIVSLWWAFCITPTAAFGEPAGDNDAGGATDASPDGDAVRENAE